MNPGRNNPFRKRMSATATLLLLIGAAFVAAGTANAALSLVGGGAGSTEAIWGLAGSADDDAGAQGDGGMQGSVESAFEGAADVTFNPPDPQPHVDAAMATAAEVQAKAQGEVDALLAQKDSLAGSGGAKWGLSGSGDGAYDVALGGAYNGGAAGMIGASGQKTLSQRVDVRGHESAAADASGEAEAAINGLLAQVEELYGKLHASFDVGLDGATSALGSVGADIGGIFGFNKVVGIENNDVLKARHRVDLAAPAMAFERVDAPDLDIPDVAVDQSGEVAMDAAATAQGIVRS